MAIKENQLPDASTVATSDDVRIVTSGGISEKADVSLLAQTILSTYQLSLLGKTQSVAAAFLSMHNGLQPIGFGFGYNYQSAATTARAVAITNYMPTYYGIVMVYFENSVPAGAALNVNNTGAKTIYYKGSAITAGVINAGDYAVFMYDGRYNLLCVTNDIQHAVIDAGTTNGWTWKKYADGRYEAEKVINMGSVTASTAMVTIEGSVKLYISPALPSDPSQSDYQPPHNYTSGTMVYDIVDNATGYMFPIKTTNGRVQIGRFATSEYTFSDVILTAKLVGGTWK